MHDILTRFWNNYQEKYEFYELPLSGGILTISLGSFGY